jgi:dTDP-4-amino-4,6-dideoxy-D-glucose transaminase
MIGQRNAVDWTAFENGMRGIFGRRCFANNGPLVQQLDREVASYCRVPYAVNVSNDMIAMMLLAKAAFGPGEVIVPVYAGFSLVEALRWGGFEPVACDVNPETLLLDAASIRRVLSPRTTGIVGIHLFGRLGDPSELEEAANAVGVPLIFDARDALGAETGGRRVGGFGVGEVLSFHQDALLNAGEGGCAVTRDETVWNKLRTLRNFHPQQTFAKMPLRMNGKMSEAPAMLALAGLQDVDEWITTNARRHAAYVEALSSTKGVSFFRDQNERSAFSRAIAFISPAAGNASIDDLITNLLNNRIEARKALNPSLGADPSSTPVGARLFDEALELPNSHTVTVDDVRRVSAVIAEGLARR